MDVVTGAFSFTGRAIAEELLDRGRKVRTLTRRDAPGDPLAARIERAELQFRDEDALRVRSSGSTRSSTPTGSASRTARRPSSRAVDEHALLVRAAKSAGARRIVHVSVTNPSLASSLPYFRGKAEVERDVAGSGLSYAIVRPTLVFGPRDILVNNIAWGLRRSPVFPIAGDGTLPRAAHLGRGHRDDLRGRRHRRGERRTRRGRTGDDVL